MRAVFKPAWLLSLWVVGCSLGVTEGPIKSLPDASSTTDQPTSDTGDPDAGALDANAPDVITADTSAPDTSAVDASLPDTSASDAAGMDAAPADVSTPDAPRADVADASATDVTTPVCATGQTFCSGACVDVRSSASHCGACGWACPGGQPCLGGVCRDPCTGVTCNGRGWCEGGACLCDPGYAGASCGGCDGVWQLVAGVSPVLCMPTRVLDGTAMDDMLVGTIEPEAIRGLEGVDTIQGLDGNDFINGNQGNDTLNGNIGRDEVLGGSENDLVQGGAGDDVVAGGLGDDRVVGGGGNDRLTGGDGSDTLEGVDGNDRYVLDGLGNDIIDDLSGDDAARCVPGVTVVSDTIVGSDRVLRLNTGGTVRIVGNRVESILGCM